LGTGEMKIECEGFIMRNFMVCAVYLR
jgi:hypothetical protein